MYLIEVHKHIFGDTIVIKRCRIAVKEEWANYEFSFMVNYFTDENGDFGLLLPSPSLLSLSFPLHHKLFQGNFRKSVWVLAKFLGSLQIHEQNHKEHKARHENETTWV